MHTNLPFVFCSPNLPLDSKESEMLDDERSGSAEKSSSSDGERKKHRFKVFARKLRSVDDHPNKSDEEDNFHDNKESKDKSPTDEQRGKKGKSYRNVESSITLNKLSK